MQAILLQPDGRIVVAGDFASFSGVARAGVARLDTDGSLDETFDPGTGVHGGERTVRALALLPNGQILVGGNFARFDGQWRNSLVRLHANGTVDTGFNPSVRVYTAGEAWIYSMAIQPDGRVILAGHIDQVNGTPCGDVVRLNSDGTLDGDFTSDPGLGSVAEVLVGEDGRIYICGGAVHVEGEARRGIARLLPGKTWRDCRVGTSRPIHPPSSSNPQIISSQKGSSLPFPFGRAAFRH